jgi:hypothetical protein
MKIFIPVVCASILMACNVRNTATVTPEIKDTIKAFMQEMESDNYVNPTRYPVDSTFGAMLMPGQFHGDEVLASDSALNYIGLFKSATEYYFLPAKIQISHVKDEILDEDDEITGIEVSTETSTDTSIFFIANMNQLAGHRFSSANLSKTQILPGDSLEIYLGEKRYLLYATGEKDGENYRNYKLFMRAGSVDELLADIASFDDAMVNILLAGDMDGDNELDILLDTSYHYNLMSPTLYLSKPASAGHLLKPVARFNSVGC